MTAPRFLQRALATLLLGMHAFPGLGVGGMERVAAYPFPLWLAAMGAMVLRRGDEGRPRQGGPPRR